MPHRLPWQRADDGFVAYPDGTERSARVARVYWGKTAGGLDAWQWSIRIGDSRTSGHESSKQRAADAATAAWPTMVAHAEKAEAEAAEAAELQRLLAASLVDGDAARLDVSGSARERLLSINWHLKRELERVIREKQDTAIVERLMAVISAELYDRRTGSGLPR